MSKRTARITYRLLIAKNIRIFRERKGITQERLGELAGLHRTYISAVEAGNRNVTIDSIERLADALEIDIRLLLTNEDISINDESSR
jgi:transcriptional regulator with XRE-family HTH domain